MIYLLLFIVLYALLILIGAISFNTEKADYLILLGCGLEKDNESLTMLRRVNRAVEYLNNNPDTKVIVSGGYTTNSEVSEASVMKRLLLEKNIVENRIIVEDRATNTIENIKYSYEFIEKNSKVVICSNEYHVFRAKVIASILGYKCKSISCISDISEFIKHIFIEEVALIYNIIKLIT